MTNVPIVSRSGQQHLLNALNVNVNVNIKWVSPVTSKPVYLRNVSDCGFFVCFFDKLNQFQKGLAIYV